MSGLHSRNSSVQSNSTTASSVGNVQLASIMLSQDRRARGATRHEQSRSVAFEIPLETVLSPGERRRSKRISKDSGSKLRKSRSDSEATPRRSSIDSHGRQSSQGAYFRADSTFQSSSTLAGSMKELPPLPLHVPQHRRVSAASVASARSLLPRLDLGTPSLDISAELLSPEAITTEEPEWGPEYAKRRSWEAACSHPVDEREARRDGRHARREARRATAAWIAMLGSLENFGASSSQQLNMLTFGQAASPLISPSASSDCLDPFFPPLPAASSSVLATQAGAASLAVSTHMDKPLPPSPRLRSPSEPSASASGRFPDQHVHLGAAAAARPRRASLPVASTSQVTRGISSPKKRPPLANLLARIEDVEEGPASAPMSQSSQRSLSLPGNPSQASLPTLSSTQTITPVDYHSRFKQRRYRFPSASSTADSDGAGLTPTSYTFPSSHEMFRTREHSFSSASGGSGGFYSSDGERSRRSSNFTADSSVPSPRSPGFDEPPDAITPKLVSEAFPTQVDGKPKAHLRIDSTASRLNASAAQGLKRSPTMEIVMYGVAM